MYKLRIEINLEGENGVEPFLETIHPVDSMSASVQLKAKLVGGEVDVLLCRNRPPAQLNELSALNVSDSGSIAENAVAVIAEISLVF